MTKRMLIDATHAEETRVVVMDGNRLEDFDVETSTKKQLKGNIYLAKVVRVEPSLQAAFIEFGGNRHGFLAFGEIHPDYYQIPVADRQRLLEAQAEEAREEEEAEDRAAAAAAARDGDATPPAAAEVAPAADPAPTTDDDGAPSDPVPVSATDDTPASASDDVPASTDDGAPPGAAQAAAIRLPSLAGPVGEEGPPAAPDLAPADAAPAPAPAGESLADEVMARAIPADAAPDSQAADPDAEDAPAGEAAIDHPAAEAAMELPGTDEVFAEAAAAEAAIVEEAPGEPAEGAVETLPVPETVGGEGDGAEERDRRIPPRFLRNYKIQEVIKRRQILLVQVVKEERGTKGAALTTYISLAGRFCVLMPNSPRGGGISRKITSAADRRRLKEITAELDIPRGMGLIVRTAGANRPKPEIKRDCEYLMRLWDDIREHTMRSVAPALIYEEASLIKRSIRDVYSRDLDEILVDGEDGWKTARDFMRMLMPSHAKKVQIWRDGGQSLFARNGVDAQLDAMMSPTVQLRSGGYLVINQAEALVAIDVNSGRSTRERGIEETALRTNLEAADEVARQLRLRDLAGLVVIDFIDMESKKHNAMVERRIKDALKNDRARIQVGHISHFGLLEMSRQRLRPSLAETNFVPCPHCGGSGHVRGTESSAIHVLRQIEEEGAKRRSAEAVVHAAAPVALYILNHKRARLEEIEARHGLSVSFAIDDKLIPPEIRIERIRAAVPSELPPAITPDLPPPTAALLAEDEDAVEEADVADEDADAAEPARTPAGQDAAGEEDGEDADRRRRRRRRRRRGGRADGAGAPDDLAAAAPESGAADTVAAGEADTAMEGVPERPGEEAEAAAADAEGDAGADVRADAGADAGAESGRGRTRSRRGGRRRRRDDEPAAAGAPDAPQPEVPVTFGPTPANPFGGHVFDIFDLMDPDAARPPLPPVATPEPPPAPEPAQAEADQPEAAEPEHVQPEPAQSEPVQSELPQSEPVEAEPLEAESVEAVAPEAEPEDAAPAEPLVKPILVGADGEPAAERKRGWWRR